MSTIGSLIINVIANAEKVKPGLQQAKNLFSGFGSGLQTMAQGMGQTLVSSLIPTVAVGALGHTVQNMVQENIQEFRSLAKAAQKAHVDINEMAGLQTLVGSDKVEVLDKALKRLNLELGKAGAGSEEARRSFEGMGLSWEKMQAAGTAGAFRMIAEEVKGAKSGYEQTRIAAEAFGSKAGPELQVALAKGAAGMDAAMKKAEDLGRTYSSAEQAAAMIGSSGMRSIANRKEKMADASKDALTDLWANVVGGADTLKGINYGKMFQAPGRWRSEEIFGNVPNLNQRLIMEQRALGMDQAKKDEEASKRFTDNSKERAKAIDLETAQLTMSAASFEGYKAKLEGATAADLIAIYSTVELADAKRRAAKEQKELADETENATKQAAKGVKELIKGWNEAADYTGQTAEEIKLLEARAKGAWVSFQDMAKAGEAAGKRMTQELRANNPLEMFQEQMGVINRLQQQGFLGVDAAAQLAMNNWEKVAGKIEDTKAALGQMPKAMQAGSQEEIAALYQFRSEQDKPSAEQRQADMLEQWKQMNADQKERTRIARESLELWRRLEVEN